jgi:hypothetical protein
MQQGEKNEMVKFTKVRILDRNRLLGMLEEELGHDDELVRILKKEFFDSKESSKNDFSSNFLENLWNSYDFEKRKKIENIILTWLFE